MTIKIEKEALRYLNSRR